jgi:hypothetical protein
MPDHKNNVTGGEPTILARSNDKSYSLRTTVPKGIVNQFELKDGDKIFWKIKPSSDGRGLYIAIEIEKTGKGK